MKKVSVITVNYNQPEITEKMLNSIISTNNYDDFEVLVVDNGSLVNPIPGWISRFPTFTFIRSDINLGFAGGNNLAIPVSSGNYLFFVNNDTEFTEGLTETLVKTMENNPKAGIISPKIRYFDHPDIIQYAGFSSMNYFTGRNKCLGQYEADNGQYDNLTGKTGFAHGAAMMVSRLIIEKVGPMSEIFFLYYEEMDWCESIKRLGFEIWFDPKALIYHKESISVGKKSSLKEYFMNRNRILFIRRNSPAFQRTIFYFYFAFIVFPRNTVKYFISNRFDLMKQFIKAVKWNILHHKNSSVLGFKAHDIK